jgi:hypothetical protein
VGRRRFDHLVLELSLALDVCVPRYALWLRLHEEGFDPEALGRAEALAFCAEPLGRFLEELGLELAPRRLRRLRRTLGRFDPGRPTPYERIAESG